MGESCWGLAPIEPIGAGWGCVRERVHCTKILHGRYCRKRDVCGLLFVSARV